MIIGLPSLFYLVGKSILLQKELYIVLFWMFGSHHILHEWTCLTNHHLIIFFYSCRLLGIPFFVAFFAPVASVVAGNLLAFCLIFRSLQTSADRVTSNREISGSKRARQAFTITVLLGLTWIFGILAIDDAKLVFQWLFCIFNTLQGFFVFFFNCILHTGIRQQWQKRFQKQRNVPIPDVPLQQTARNNTRTLIQ